MASTFPKITIITPTYNQGEFIEKTIISVLDQNYPNLEYIIIDGGSTDATIDIIKKYEKQITYLISEPDHGQSDAINKGFKLASGDIINWLNSDDYLDEDVLFKIASDFQKPNIDLVCGYAELITNAGLISKRTSQLKDDFALFISRGHIMQPSTFFRKSVFDEFTPIATNLHYMMDHYLWLQYVCKKGVSNVLYVDYKISNVLLHENAKSYKMIGLFKEDKGIIYSSLFSSLKLGFIYPDVKHLNKLSFNCDYLGDQIILNNKEINFFLLLDILFSRDSSGNREHFNFNIAMMLLVNFPSQLFLYIFKRVFK
jgi:glycosyltransferase involved in cell wall biosynthesis